MPTLRQDPGKLIERTGAPRVADGRRDYQRKMSTLLGDGGAR